MDGVTWRADNHAFADVMPPRAFGCRCAITTLDAEDLAEGGYVVSTNVPAGFSVAPGHGVEGLNRVLAGLKGKL